MPTRFNSPRFGGALRFAVTLVAVNLLALAVFPGGPAATFASFSVVASLYFLDFDGNVRERIVAYAFSALIGIAGIGVGLSVAGNTVAVCAAALIVGFAFAAARVFRGFVARSFIGVQLAFVLTVVTPTPRDHALEIVAGWVLGAIASLVTALIVFPRHHSGVLRRALSAWFSSAAVLAGEAARGASVHPAKLQEPFNELARIDRSHMIAGLWSRRTRALAECERAAAQITGFVAQRPGSLKATAADRELFASIAEALQGASQTVLFNTPIAEAVDLAAARQRHTDRLVAQSQSLGNTAIIDAASKAIDVRVISLGAEAIQYLAAISRGSMPTKAVTSSTTTPNRLRLTTVFRTDSVWLFSGIRTGIALAAALGIALQMGLEHGVWVAMAALALINVSATTRGASVNALTTMSAVMLGVLISIGVIVLQPTWLTLLGIVLSTAFLAKWFLSSSVFWGQLSYTPFAIANVAMLNWPVPHGIAVVRIEDIAVGLAVAVTATAFAFPFGLHRLLETVWQRSQSAVRSSINASLNDVAAGRPFDPEIRQTTMVAVDLFHDAVDTVGIDESTTHPLGRECSDRVRWLTLSELYVSALDMFDIRRKGRPLPDGLRNALKLTAQSSQHHLDAVRLSPETEDKCALVLATWAAAGLDILQSLHPHPKGSP